MIENIIEMLRLDQWYGKSELIEIAKGKYQKPSSIKEIREQLKRDRKWKRRP